MITYFAELDKDNIVLRIIVASQQFIDSGVVGNPSNWIQTSVDDSNKIKTKNHAGIGYTYDKARDAFIQPKVFESWILDEKTAIYIAPKQKPSLAHPVKWDEDVKDWINSI